MLYNSFWSNTEWVTPEIIQELFNQSQFYERLQRGELHKKVWGYDNHLNRRQRQRIHEPLCTRSQIVIYYELTGQPVALVHQYLRRNSELGGSGRPDPKRLFISGRVIAVSQSP